MTRTRSRPTGASSEPRWSGLSPTGDPVEPGVVHSRRDAIMLALIAMTCTGIWALVGGIIVLVLRAG